MKLYNFLTNKFEEIKKKQINWYCCGPAVHATTHMGHARTFAIYVLQDTPNGTKIEKV